MYIPSYLISNINNHTLFDIMVSSVYIFKLCSCTFCPSLFIEYTKISFVLKAILFFQRLHRYHSHTDNLCQHYRPLDQLLRGEVLRRRHRCQPHDPPCSHNYVHVLECKATSTDYFVRPRWSFRYNSNCSRVSR